MPKVHDKNALIFRENVGTATEDDGEEIELTTSMNRSPIVRIEGQFISFSWEELIDQAREALDKEKESNAATSDSKLNNTPKV